MQPRWLKKLYNRVNRWAALKEIDPNDRTSELRVELEVLDPSLFDSLDPIKSILTRFDTSYRNFETFTRVLNWLALVDHEQVDHTTQRYNVGSYNVSLEEYFFSESGIRLTPATSVENFKLATQRLIVVYREKLLEHDTGTLGHNARLVYAHLAEALRLVHILRLHYENSS